MDRHPFYLKGFVIFMLVLAVTLFINYPKVMIWVLVYMSVTLTLGIIVGKHLARNNKYNNNE